MKKLSIVLNPDQHRALKIAAASRGISVTALVLTALNPTIGPVTQAHISMRPSMETRPLETR